MKAAVQTKKRCAWPGAESEKNRLMVKYHDLEWGVPVHSNRKLFEYFVLDAFQAGLSWAIVLRKRENFRRAFAGFDPEKISRFNAADVKRLMGDEGIIRNRLKIEATINNAVQYFEVKKEFGSFSKYIWQFTGGKTIHHLYHSLKDIPARTEESDAMSSDLKKRGFKFVGSTICYAFMQAAGLVNDHMLDCYRYRELKRAAV